MNYHPARRSLILVVSGHETFMSYLTIILILLFVVQAYASIVVTRVPNLSKRNRFLQLVIIWLVPLIGGIVCIAFARNETNSTPPPKSSGDFIDPGGYG